MNATKILLALGLATLPAIAPAPETTQEATAPTVVLGTFDSRVLALAYYRSEAFFAILAADRKAHEAAQQVGDEEAARRIEERMQSLQKHVHAQGFGNAPVDDILALLGEDIPAVAKRTGVDIIVSKWHLVHQDADAETVDVSFLLAERFAPSAETLKIMRDAQAQPPVPLDQLRDDD